MIRVFKILKTAEKRMVDDFFDWLCLGFVRGMLIKLSWNFFRVFILGWDDETWASTAPEGEEESASVTTESTSTPSANTPTTEVAKSSKDSTKTTSSGENSVRWWSWIWRGPLLIWQTFRVGMRLNKERQDHVYEIVYDMFKLPHRKKASPDDPLPDWLDPPRNPQGGTSSNAMVEVSSVPLEPAQLDAAEVSTNWTLWESLSWCVLGMLLGFGIFWLIWYVDRTYLDRRIVRTLTWVFNWINQLLSRKW